MIIITIEFILSYKFEICNYLFSNSTIEYSKWNNIIEKYKNKNAYDLFNALHNKFLEKFDKNLLYPEYKYIINKISIYEETISIIFNLFKKKSKSENKIYYLTNLTNFNTYLLYNYDQISKTNIVFFLTYNTFNEFLKIIDDKNYIYIYIIHRFISNKNLSLLLYIYDIIDNYILINPNNNDFSIEKLSYNDDLDILSYINKDYIIYAEECLYNNYLLTIIKLKNY